MDYPKALFKWKSLTSTNMTPTLRGNQLKFSTTVQYLMSLPTHTPTCNQIQTTSRSSKKFTRKTEVVSSLPKINSLDRVMRKLNLLNSNRNMKMKSECKPYRNRNQLLKSMEKKGWRFSSNKHAGFSVKQPTSLMITSQLLNIKQKKPATLWALIKC
jgi:hypothetical protein